MKTYLVGSYEKYFNEALLMNTHNMFGWEIRQTFQYFLDKKAAYLLLDVITVDPPWMVTSATVPLYNSQ